MGPPLFLLLLLLVALAPLKSTMDAAGDAMKEIAGFLEEYESCVRDHFPEAEPPTPTGSVSTDEADDITAIENAVDVP